MLIIGLTGSIATGKSTVSKLLSSPPYSLTIIDADVLAREVVAPGTPGYTKIVAHFLPTTPDLLLPAESDPVDSSNGSQNSKGRPLDRAALGRRVFGTDPSHIADRKVLNSIVHPAVRKAMFWGVLWAYFRGERAVVLDVPLLFESRLDAFCGAVIVVGVKDPDVQLRRLVDRDAGKGLTEEEARRRVESQGNVEGKVKRVKARGERWGAVVWNDDGRAKLEKEVDGAMKRVTGGSPKWWCWALWGIPPLAASSAAWCFAWGWWARRGFERSEKSKYT